MHIRDRLDRIEPIKLIIAPREALSKRAIARIILIGHLIVHRDFAA